MMEGAHGYRPASNNHTIKKPLVPVTSKKPAPGFHERTGSGLEVFLLGLLFDLLNFFENHAYMPELGLGIFENQVFEP